ncbi:tyrosine-type recombinase/integrase [Kitasatospora sp. NPDC094011]|uniref:tyrosine-type recombinase/integrase n=1 Tax=Kitasatospora sp. NPDC094011 TaxID=3364090 RepID=UPI00382F1054
MATTFQKCKTDRTDPCTKTRCGHPWTVRFREPGGRAGRQREKTFPTKKEADNFGIKVENDKRERVYIDPTAGAIPVHVFAREWLKRRAVKETTRKNYENFIERHLIPALGRKTIAGVRPSDIETLCSDMCAAGLSRRTVYHSNMVPLRSIFKSAVSEKLITESPVTVADLPKVKTKRVDERSLPDGKAVGRVAGAMRDDWAVSVWLMAGCGLRIGEALGVKLTDFQNGILRLRRQVVHVKREGKWTPTIGPLKQREEGEWRDVPVPPSVQAAVTRHVETHGLADDGYLMHTLSGAVVRDSNYRTEFARSVKAAGYGDEPWTAHYLRHFFASSAIAGGVSLLEVSRWLGHSTIRITADIYGHLSPDAGERLRAVMDEALSVGPVILGTDQALAA